MTDFQNFVVVGHALMKARSALETTAGRPATPRRGDGHVTARLPTIITPYGYLITRVQRHCSGFRIPGIRRCHALRSVT